MSHINDENHPMPFVGSMLKGLHPIDMLEEAPHRKILHAKGDLDRSVPDHTISAWLMLSGSRPTSLRKLLPIAERLFLT